MTEPNVANLRKAASAVYLACDAAVADDISNLLKWAADQVEALTHLKGASHDALASFMGDRSVSDIVPGAYRIDVNKGDYEAARRVYWTLASSPLSRPHLARGGE